MQRLLLSLAAGAALLIAMASAHRAEARDNFVTSPTAPYPPGCVSSNNAGVSTPTTSRQVYADDIITLTDAAGGADAGVNVQVYRRGCIEEGRSLLYIEFESVTTNRIVAVPRVFISRGETRIPMRLTPEANTFEVDQTAMYLPNGSFLYLVDGPAESRVTGETPVLTPDEYSGALTLFIQDALDEEKEYSVRMPQWLETIRPLRYPLNGRLSGAWVSAGAERQGFLIAFNEFVTEEGARQQVFFSWYTYDADGQPLWLTAGAFHDLGASSVTLPVVLLTGGEFLGDATPEETAVGDAILTAESCGELTLDYDLESIGLGQGSLTLTRSFAVETAGYACRDVQARLEELGG